jgi:hypothetical protein
MMTPRNVSLMVFTMKNIGISNEEEFSKEFEPTNEEFRKI